MTLAPDRVLAVVTFAIKAFGPITAGRSRAARLVRARDRLAGGAALLHALVVTPALADGEELAIGRRHGGVAAAGIALWRGVPIAAAVVVAAAVTALLRAVT